jgi:hypothetical protein
LDTTSILIPPIPIAPHLSFAPMSQKRSAEESDQKEAKRVRSNPRRNSLFHADGDIVISLGPDEDDNLRLHKERLRSLAFFRQYDALDAWPERFQLEENGDKPSWRVTAVSLPHQTLSTMLTASFSLIRTRP